MMMPDARALRAWRANDKMRAMRQDMRAMRALCASIMMRSIKSFKMSARVISRRARAARDMIKDAARAHQMRAPMRARIIRDMRAFTR